MTDDAPDLEAEQRARRVEIQHDDRKVPVLNRIERQVDAGEEERLGVPPRAAIHPQLDLPAHLALTGILASLVNPLAEARVNIFAFSTHDTDYVLVPAVRLHEALAALSRAGHRVATPATP